MSRSLLNRLIPSVVAGAALLMLAPMASGAGDGRWKLDGNGGCYFDQNDTGPNQCEPSSGIPENGRWKLDGNGACYLDPNDSGPDQCAPSGQPAPAGRWKLDGAGNCYFDNTDSGPNQCVPDSGTLPH